MTTTGAKNPLAQKFLAFMTGPEFQDVIPETNWMFPAGKTDKPLNPAFDKLVKPAKTLLFSPEEVAAEPQGLGRRMAGGDERVERGARPAGHLPREMGALHVHAAATVIPPRRSPASLALARDRAPDRRRVRRPASSKARAICRGARRRLRPLSLPRRPLHAVAGGAVDAAFGRAGDLRRARPVAASALSGPRPDPAAVRPAAGAAGDRRGARHPGALRPRRLFRRLALRAVGRRLARHLRPVRHSGRACLLQPAAGDAAFPRSAGHACRPTSGGWRASSAWAPARRSG